jgi:leucyl/phenylalanyl-tRNA--protein transferase
MPVFLLPDDLPVFPDPRQAEADGLLALGGGLEPARLLLAYSRGIFPWNAATVSRACGFARRRGWW